MGQTGGHTEAFRSLAGSPSGALSHVGRELGDYRLLQLIGEGGMGWVYLARHARIGRRVAIKMLRPELNADPIAVRRFFEEARAVNRIQHDNIVQIHDFVDNEDGATYLVLELLVGRDLLSLLEGGGPLPIERSLGIMVQAAQALTEVHACGVVHRDLKPENIFLVDRPGQPDLVKLLDFGIAKLRGGGADGRITRAGTSLGTPDYIAPEQALGADVDHRADVYSFGVILYELVTGRRPFASEDVTLTIARQVTEVPARPRTLRAIPRALDELVMECMAKRPSERPAGMAQVEARLREVVAALDAPGEVPSIELELGVDPDERPRAATSVRERPRRALRPRRAALAGAAVLAVIALGIGHRRAPVETPSAAADPGDPASETTTLPPREDPVTTTAPASTVTPPGADDELAAATEPPPAPPKPRARRKRAAPSPRSTRPPGRTDVLPVYQD